MTVIIEKETSTQKNQSDQQYPLLEKALNNLFDPHDCQTKSLYHGNNEIIIVNGLNYRKIADVIILTDEDRPPITE